jgi:hypothetical protein
MDQELQRQGHIKPQDQVVLVSGKPIGLASREEPTSSNPIAPWSCSRLKQQLGKSSKVLSLCPSPELSRVVMQALDVPEGVSQHFRNASVEVLKGLRVLPDHRIEKLTRTEEPHGTRVAAY